MSDPESSLEGVFAAPPEYDPNSPHGMLIARKTLLFSRGNLEHSMDAG